MQINKLQKKDISIIVLETIFCFISLSIDFDVPQNYDYNTISVKSNLLNSFHAISPLHILILLGLIFVFYFSMAKIEKKKADIILFIPALLISVFNYIGLSFSKSGDWGYYFAISNGQIFKSIVKTLGMSIISFHVIKCLYYFFDKKAFFFDNNVMVSKNTPSSKFVNLLSNNPFWFTFILLFLIYIPYTIASYPATFQEDANSVLFAFYKESGYFYLFDLVPLLYTFVVKLFFEFGIRLFANGNIGLFLLSLTQLACVIAAIASMVKYLIKVKRIHPWLAVFIIGFYAFLPLIQTYMFLLIKDVFYCTFFIWFLLCLERILEDKTKPFEIIKVILLGLIVFLLRNDAPYVLLLLFMALFVIYRKRRLLFVIMAIAVLLLQFVARPSIYSAMGVHENEADFLYSIPAQQTARCVVYLDDAIDEEDKIIIDNALGYEKLKGQYCPENTNNIMWGKISQATLKDKVLWLKVWLKLLVKHPGTCIQATLNVYYGYLTLDYRPMDINTYDFSRQCMTNILPYMTWGDYDFYYPSQLDRFRNLYMDILFMLRKFPVVGFFMIPSVYFWNIVLLWFYKIRNKSMEGTLWLIVSSIIMLVCLTAPASAYYGRYEYPVVMMFPITLICAISGKNIIDNTYKES